jgi:hypothetical protein
VDYDQNPTQAEPSRLLVAADEGIDPHRLVRLCCERAAPDLLGVSLLVPNDDEPAAWAESAAPGGWPATPPRYWTRPASDSKTSSSPTKTATR